MAAEAPDLRRGQVVKPNAEAIDVTRYTARSRLVVSLARRHHHCKACLEVRRKKGQRRTFEDSATQIRPGEFYARGKEPSSGLCLWHVEAT